MDLLESAYRSLLLHCIEIRKQALLLPENLKSISDIPYFSSGRMMSVSLHEIGANLDIIAAHTYAAAWNARVANKYILKFEKLKSVILRTLEEVEVTLDKVRDLLVKCEEAGIELSANTNVCELESLKNTIRSLKSLDVLFPYSQVYLDGFYLSTLNNWVTVIQSLPVTVKKLNLEMTKIDATVLCELSRLTSLNEIGLKHVKLSNPDDWASVIQSLPVTVKKIDLSWTNVDESGHLALSRLTNLEEIALGSMKQSNTGDWGSVIRCLPVTVNKLDLGDANIKVSGFRELSRLSNLEEIKLWYVELSHPDDWVTVIQSLPVTVKKLDLSTINIDDSGLCELSRLTNLEEMTLSLVRLTNPDDWASVIQSLPVTVKKIKLEITNIDASGLRELSRLSSLEEIIVLYSKFSDPAAWIRWCKSCSRQ